MKNIIIREPKIEDKESFLQAMQHSQSLHHSWVNPPLISKEYDDYLLRAQQPNQQSFLVCNQVNDILGVFKYAFGELRVA
jgi:hypothetical protein